jgi:putative peptide zinc metalloprotease protein
VLFNANPLMRFDGYYMLTDLLEQPNLATHGQSCLLSLGRRWMLGLPGHVNRWPEGRTWLVLLYGVAALLWRVIICVGLIMAAEALYFGAGVLLAAIAVFFWVVLPVAKLLRFVAVGSKTERPSRRRFAMTAGLLVASLAVVSRLPWYQRIEAPAVVDYDPVMDLRAGTGGFVEVVNVSGGQFVRQGTPLMVLRNPELEMRRTQVATGLQQSRQRGRLFHERQEIAAWQAEVENANALADRLGQLDARLAQLVICAPVDGIVLDNELQSLLGSYVSAGEHVVSLGTGGEKRLLVMVSEEKIDAFEERVNCAVNVHIWGMGGHRLSGTLQKLEPRGSTRILHPAFAASSGGPLEVRVVAHESDISKSVQETTYEFAEPQFLTRVVLDSDALLFLDAGRTGFVRFRSHRGSLGHVAQLAVIRWWRSRQAALQQHWSS